MTNHIYLTPEEHNCNGQQGCMICDGGLALCKVCMCLEGGLASECPGEVVDMKTQQKIYEGKIDFLNGHWIAGVSEHSPVLYRRYTAIKL